MIVSRDFWVGRTVYLELRQTKRKKSSSPATISLRDGLRKKGREISEFALIGGPFPQTMSELVHQVTGTWEILIPDRSRRRHGLNLV